MRIIAVLLAVLVTTGCNVLENEQSVPTELVGAWEWTFTAGGAWSPPVSADTTGYEMSLIIYSQNKASWFRNDTLMDNYSIKDGDSDWTEGKLVMRRAHTEDVHGCGFVLDYRPDSRELLLSSADCTDLPAYHFRKKRD